MLSQQTESLAEIGRLILPADVKDAAAQLG
jgi:hypothetical protein